MTIVWKQWRLILNQPDNGNPLNTECAREFSHAANFLSGQSAVRAVLLAARGRFFSVGGDLSLFAKNLENLHPLVCELTFSLHMGIARLMRMDAPIIACVQGSAAGGALALLANCDLIYSVKTAHFSAAYSKIGLSCDMGATTGLASRIGLARARRFLVLGETVSASEAAQMGLVDFLCDEEELTEQAKSAALRISQGPTRAYGEIRRLMIRSLGQPFESQLEDEAQAIARLSMTFDVREGITSFTEKRAPSFKAK